MGGKWQTEVKLRKEKQREQGLRDLEQLGPREEGTADGAGQVSLAGC